jgi:hypothetical protein
MLKLFVQVHEMDYEMVDDHHPRKIDFSKFVNFNKKKKNKHQI